VHRESVGEMLMS